VTFGGLGNFVAPSVPPKVTKPKAKLTPKQKFAKALRACRKKRGRSKCEGKARKQYRQALKIKNDQSPGKKKRL
jgi:hypothetical protein